MVSSMRRSRTLQLFTTLVVLICFFNVLCLEGLADEIVKASTTRSQEKTAADKENSRASEIKNPKKNFTASSARMKDFASSPESSEFLVSDPVDVVAGKVYEKVTDFSVPCKGGLLDLRVQRIYSSTMPTGAKLRSFDYRWMFEYDTYLWENGIYVGWKTPEGAFIVFASQGNGTYLPFGYPYVLTKNANNTFTLLEKQGGKKWHFSVKSQYVSYICSLTKIEDRNGNAITMSYVGGKITRATESGGKYVTFAYDGTKRITRITDPRGSAYTYVYDALSGNNLNVYYPHSTLNHWGYGFDANHVLTQKSLEYTGNWIWKYIWNYSYDANGKCTKVTYPDSTYDTIAYPAAGRTTYTNAAGRTTTYYYDSNNLITRTTDTNGNNVYLYYQGRNLTRKTDARGQEYYYYYAGFNKTREVKPGNIITDYTYNDFSQVTSKLDPLGRSTDYYYDAKGNLTMEVDDSGNSTTYAYDSAGKRTAMTDANEHTTTYAYDGYGQLTRETNAEDASIIYAYDIMGNCTRMTDPNNNVNTYTYDVINRLTKVTDPLSNFITYEHDRIGNRTKVIDQNNLAMSLEYDLRQNVTKITDALNQQTQFAYDSVGNMTRMTDARNNITQFGYEFGPGCGCGGTGEMVTRITYPNGDYETLQYDPNGNLVLKTNCNGNSITYAYDALNHMTQKTYPDSTTATFVYDAIGNMTSATDSDSSVFFVYDNLYRLTETAQQIYAQPNRTISYSYDPIGNRTSMTDPDNLTTSYGYSLINQLASITDVYNNATNYYYDDGGRLTLRTYGNGTKAEYSYDSAGRLTLLANKKSDDSVISSFSYELDKAGNQTKRTTPSQILQYTYDNIYEVTEVYQLQPSPAVLESFSYDAAGNRTSDASYDDYSYNSNNQLTSYDSVTLDYDKNGNLTRKTENLTNVTTYTFDYENKLTRIDYSDETYSAYKYDTLGRRIEKRDRSGNVKQYVYDGLNSIAEYDGSNSLVATYVQSLGIDYPISMFRHGGIYWYHSDALRSIYQMTDSSEVVQENYDYSAFGKIVSETGSLENPFTYTAREFDGESGLYYYRARCYDANLGRFLSLDPVFRTGRANLYVYVGNNAINVFDPEGLFHYKPGTSPANADVEEALKCMDSCLGTDLGISAGKECGLPHRPNSRHCTGEAADVSFRMNPGLREKQEEVMCCAKKCGIGYAQTEGTHFHVQIPAGRNGGHGELPDCGCDKEEK